MTDVEKENYSEILQQFKLDGGEAAAYALYKNKRITSKTCSKCGQIGSRSKGFFVCHCGYSLNADLNGAINIASKHHSKADGVLASVTKPNIQGDDVKGTVSATATGLMDKSPHL